MSRVQPQARPARPGQPVAQPAGNSAPAADGAKKKMGRPAVDKVLYREEGTDKLAEWPADFDSRIHKPLKIEDFDAEDVFLIHQAEAYERRAADCRQKAAIFQQFGSAEARKMAEKYQKFLSKMAELESELEGAGVDKNIVIENMQG